MRKHRVNRGSAEIVPPSPLDALVLADAFKDVGEWLRTRQFGAGEVLGRRAR